MEQPYEGAKEMLLVDDVENGEFLRELLEAMYDELPVCILDTCGMLQKSKNRLDTPVL